MTKDRKKQPRVEEQQGIYDVYERYEIIDHVRYDLKPSPTTDHQSLVTVLSRYMQNSCHPNGRVYLSPIDVYFDEGNCVQPDLVFILNENVAIVKKARIEGAPDLVAEVLSPRTSKNDKVRKKALYERAGVKEYWLIDPVHRTIDQWLLTDGKYHLAATYVEDDIVTSPLFACVSIEMNALFAQVSRDED